MATTSFSKKDQKIIDDNPGKSPYELVELGLSDKAFQELLAQEGEQKQAPRPSSAPPPAPPAPPADGGDGAAPAPGLATEASAPPAPSTVVKSNLPEPGIRPDVQVQPTVERSNLDQPAVMRPQLSDPVVADGSIHQTVKLRTKATGVTTSMSVKAANGLARKYPDQYEIVS